MDENTWQRWQTREMAYYSRCMTEQELIKDPGFIVDARHIVPALHQSIIDIVKYSSTRLCTNGKMDKHKLIYLLERVRASM